MPSRLSAFLLVSLLAGCASLPSPAPREDRVTLFYSSSKHGELVPCGCSMAPMGGVGREWNAIQEERSSVIGKSFLFAGGTTFVPEAGKYKASDIALYRQNAEVVAEALAKAGFQAVSPSADDLSLGFDTLKTLEAKHGVPFVSANLVAWDAEQSLFPRSIRFYSGKTEFVVTGLSAYGKSGHVPSGFGVQRPEFALKKALAGVSPTAVVIVLSNLEAEDIQAAAKAVDRPTLWLGAAESAVTLDPQALDRKNVRLSAYGKGMYLSRLDLELDANPNGFYDIDGAGGLKQDIEVWKESVVEIEATLKTKKVAAKQRQALLAHKKRLESSLASVSGIPLQHGPGLVTYHGKSIPLGAMYQQPQNALYEIARRGPDLNRALAENPPSSHH